MQPLFAYNAVICKNTISILTLILFVVFLVRELYLFCSFRETSFERQSGFPISTTCKGQQKLFLVAEGKYPRQAKAQEIHSVLSNVTFISYTEGQDPAKQVPANGGA